MPRWRNWCSARQGSADAISVASGNLFEQVSDYSTAGTNRLAFIRSYNALSGSQSSSTDPGGSWRSNYDRYLSIYSASSPATATAERPDGRIVSFTQQGGAWVGDTDVDVTLVSSGNNWTLTDYNDSVETYVPNSVGVLQLTTITARGGYKQNLTYNAAGQLSKVTDTNGRTLTFTYTGALLTSVLTPDNTTLAYGYTASGGTGTPLSRLASVTFSTSPTTSQTYVYENTSFPFALTGIIDEDGNRFTAWTYDKQERAISSQHAGDADLTHLTYNAGGSTTAERAR